MGASRATTVGVRRGKWLDSGRGEGITLRRVALASVLLAGSSAFVGACSQANLDVERTGQTSQALTLTGQTNYFVAGAVPGSVEPDQGPKHETAVAAASHCQFAPNGGCQHELGNWVVAFNNLGGGGPPGCCNDGFEWATSYDLNLDPDPATGLVWNVSSMQTGLDFGVPPEPACAGTFTGLFADPSLAPVYDEVSMGTGARNRVMMTMTANDPAGNAADVFIDVSDDGGKTWAPPCPSGTGCPSHAHLLSNNAINGGQLTCGGIDNPVIATQKAYPYDSFVTWTTAPGTTVYGEVGWLTDVHYDAQDNFTQNQKMPNKVPLEFMTPSGEPVVHPTIDVGQVPVCFLGQPTGKTHEAVIIAWTTNGGRCSDVFGPVPGGCDNTYDIPVSYWAAAYDVVDQRFFAAPSELATFDSGCGSWPQCTGIPVNGAGIPSCEPGSAYCDPNVWTNNSNPKIAADPNGTRFWVAYVAPQTNGTTIETQRLEWVCNAGGSVQPTTWSMCHPAPVATAYICPGVRGPDGGILTNDQWEPSIAYDPQNGALLWTWYDTWGDPNNDLVNVWAAYSDGDNPPWNLFPLTKASSNPPGQIVPWDHDLADTWDYQAVAADLHSGSFLGAWGGDARLSAQPGVWSAKIQ